MNPEHKAIVVITLLAGLLTLAALGMAVLFVAKLVSDVEPAPTTYETGLYVESEQVQQTIDGKELQ